MSCQIPYKSDSSQRLLWKIASCLAAGDAAGSVFSFNGRQGVVTLSFADVVGALGCTPACANDVVTSFNGRQGAVTLLLADVSAVADARYVLKSGDFMTGLLNINTAVTSLQTIVTDAGTTNVPFVFELYHRSSGVPAAGFGSRIQFYGNSSTTADQFQSRIESTWVDATHATRSSQLAFGTRTSGGVISTPLILRDVALGRNGLVGAPFYSFQNELGSGMWLNGVGNLSFSVAGATIINFKAAGVDLTSGLAYQYNSVNVIRAITALNDYFLGPSGNLTMTGIDNTATGFEALLSNTSGSFNNANGSGALRANTTGGSNAAFGYLALNANTTGSFNVGMGPRTLTTNTTGSFSVAVGYQALTANTTGALNTAVGYGALFTNTTGTNNTALGYAALNLNTTGSDNVAIGHQALVANTTGIESVAIGDDSLFLNTSGNFNIAVGHESLRNNTTGILNTAIGYQAMRSNTTVATNVAVGYAALFSSTVSPNNTAIGAQSLQDVTTAATGQNTAVGYNTGRGITTGSNNTILGANVTGLAAALANNIILADGAGNQRINVDSSGNTTLAGTAATADGTAALPAKTFSADLDTGFYRIGANSIGTTTNGVLRITTNATDVILAAGFRLAMASGANQRAGNATLVAGTVTVANTSVTANTIVLLTRKTSGGTIGTAITYSVIAATSFTIQSDSIIDTSVFSYLLIEVP